MRFTDASTSSTWLSRDRCGEPNHGMKVIFKRDQECLHPPTTVSLSPTDKTSMAARSFCTRPQGPDTSANLPTGVAYQTA